MKTVILFAFGILGLAISCLGQELKTLSGKFSVVSEACGCSAFGMLSYVENGVSTRAYLCFDSEPGDFYEIQSGEEITVSGIEKGILCSNGTLYKNLYVFSSELPILNRQMLVPEFLKKQNSNIPSIKPILEIDKKDFKIDSIKFNIKPKQEESNKTLVLSNEEQKLYNLIMEYRKQKGLPSILLSQSLTLVAQTHVRDLEDNFVLGTNCNTHSWSDKGRWTSCCYTSDHAQKECMWNKPRELTSYKGNGFEIAFGGAKGYVVTAEAALKAWKGSSGHTQVIINSDIWKKHPWNAIGIGIYKGYAVVWFGKEEDK